MDINKIQIKKILGILIIFLLIINTNVLVADTKEDAKKGLSALEQGISSITGVINDLFGGPSWMHGVVSGFTSGINTYSKLGRKVRLEVERDKVNLSDNNQDYSSDDKNYLDTLNINLDPKDPKTDIVLTDKNTLDLEYIETIDNLQEYYDPENNPNMRVEEKTNQSNVLDWNGQKVKGQERGLLFDDKNKTIEDAYEYRNLILRYPSLRYKKDPVPIKLNFGDLDVKWYKFFTSGVTDIKEKVTDKLDKELSSDEVIEPINLLQTFHLLFHSRVANDDGYVSDVLPDCRTLGGASLGYTGTEYLPNVSYDWDFSDDAPADVLKPNESGDPRQISRNHWCDVDQDGIYCDSTQFTIELLLKIKEINDIVKDYHNEFTCPPQHEERSLVSDTNNTGITYLEINKTNNNQKLEVNYSLSGNYDVDPTHFTGKLFDINTFVEYKNPNSFVWQELDSTIETVDSDYLVSGSTSQNFANIINISSVNDSAEIKVTVKIDNIDYNTITELESGSNASDNSLVLETSGPGSCSLNTTSENLKDYCIGTGCQGMADNLVNFDAYLMQDGYSQDFQKDFDDLYRNEFLATENWYNQDISDLYTPMYKYFKDKENFSYSTTMSDQTKDLILSSPGKYHVTIKIDYDNDWQLFNDAGQPTGHIQIILKHKLSPEVDMPVYYMPLDGVLGITDDTRINYGVSYTQDTITIVDQPSGLQSYNLETQGFSSSTPINNVEVREVEDFKIMNNDNRGQILSIRTNSTHHNPILKYAPSRASPLALRLKRENGDAYAFYKLSIGTPPEQGGYIAHPGTTLTYWTGFENCEDLTGVSSIQSYLDRADVLASQSELAPPSQSEQYSYGVESPKEDSIRVGNLWLKTILYTPANYETGTGKSYITFDSYNDQAKFYSLNDNTGSETITLEGMYNDIQSIKDIYTLISENKACVDFDSTRFDVYYNPKKVVDALKEDINSLVYSGDTSCIGYDLSNN